MYRTLLQAKGARWVATIEPIVSGYAVTRWKIAGTFVL